MNGEETVFHGLQASTIGASLLAIALVAIAHIAMKLWTRRRLERETALSASTSGGGGSRHWLALTLRDLVAPVALLLWIHALHHALTTLLAGIPLPDLARHVVPALDVLRGAGTLAAMVWLFVRVGRRIEDCLGRFATRTPSTGDDFLLPIMGTAIRLVLPMVAVVFGLQALDVPERLKPFLRDGISLVVIAAVAYILHGLIDALCKLVLSRHPVDVPDNREARTIHTQVMVLRRVILAIIGIFTLASMLMVFDPVRRFGTTILASAGVAGIVVGIAAQRSVATLLAGFQIALTQPFRIDDAVVIADEWGRIEEITLTYVVVRTWDWRRLIVPVTYFIEKPFENWTRTSADLLAPVILSVDYAVPLDRLRAELTQILESSPYWDRRVNRIQVTDSTERTMKIRVLASAPDAATTWELRCEVRERLIAFLQREYPESLPKLRLLQASGR